MTLWCENYAHSHIWKLGKYEQENEAGVMNSEAAPSKSRILIIDLNRILFCFATTAACSSFVLLRASSSAGDKDAITGPMCWLWYMRLVHFPWYKELDVLRKEIFLESISRMNRLKCFCCILPSILQNYSGTPRMWIQKICEIIRIAFDDDPAALRRSVRTNFSSGLGLAQG